MTSERITPALLLRERTITITLETQLDAGQDVCNVPGVGLVPRETAWAIACALRASLRLGCLYAGQSHQPEGDWLAHLDLPLGRFPQ